MAGDKPTVEEGTGLAGRYLGCDSWVDYCQVEVWKRASVGTGYDGAVVVRVLTWQLFEVSVR